LLSDAANELHSYTQSLTGEPFIIDTPGEFDVKDFAVNALPIWNDKHLVTAHLIQTEGMTVLNLGNISELKLNEDELEDLGDVDILLVPVGGNAVMDGTMAAKAVNMIEPKIVIPMD
jgi:L-ascorbate metabolism protein UlaG (beta-lactamase superfamily)